MFSESYCQVLQTFSTEDVPDNTSFSLTYCKSLLTGISAKSSFIKVFYFKKLKKYCVLLRYLLFFVNDCKHLPFSSKLYQPEMNFTRPFNVVPRTVACNRIT